MFKIPSISLSFIYSVNTAVEATPDLVSGDQAEELLNKSPVGGDVQPVSDLGK
jgi:hypothetical protein